MKATRYPAGACRLQCIRDMRWFKFYGQDWMTDPKIAGMSMEDRLCFLTLLCIASSDTKGDGVVKGITEDVLISMARIPDWRTEEYNPGKEAIGVLSRLQSLQIVTLSSNTLGNTDVTLRNYSIRQEQNSSNAEKQRKYRERLKQRLEIHSNVTVTDSNGGGNVLHRIEENRIDKKIDNITHIIAKADDEFDSFWKEYPKKIGKGAAKKSWEKSKKPPILEILQAISIQKNSSQWRKDSGQFIPNPATWLNQQRWDDEIEVITSNNVDKF